MPFGTTYVYLVKVQGHFGHEKKLHCDIYWTWRQQCYDPAISAKGECSWRNGCVKWRTWWLMWYKRIVAKSGNSAYEVSHILKSLLFWNVTQCRLVVSYWSFKATFQSLLHMSGSPRLLDPWRWNLDTVLKLRSPRILLDPWGWDRQLLQEEQRCHLYRGESLKSCKAHVMDSDWVGHMCWW